MSTNVVELAGITKRYRGKTFRTVEALKDLDLVINGGEVFGFLGPNGAGKSTTIKIMMGLIRPDSGAAKIAGVDAGSAQARIKVGYLPENPAFYDFLSAEEYLRFVGNTFRMPSDAISVRSEETLKLLELWDARKRPIRSYSKGMVQRLGLAQVLLHDPDLYILDEPMSGLDPLGRALVKGIISGLRNRGKTVFFSTHITADVETICDRVGIIVAGTLESVQRVGNLLEEGIRGYTLRIKTPEGMTEQYVPKTEFSRAIAEATTAGNEVVLVEPQRNDLERYFLSIVQKRR